MINTKHLLKVTSVWISVVYVVCYAGVALFPSSRNLYMKYALHADISFKSNYFGIGYFIVGLVTWNIIALLGAGLFSYLFNTIRK